MRLYTLEDIIQPYQHYPKTVQIAIIRAHTHPAFFSITMSMRKVLCALLTRASEKDGLRPLKARLENVADEAGVSAKTVQRALAHFRQLGWLCYNDEDRNEYGIFRSRTYRLTPQICALIELPVKGEKAESCPRETEMSDGAVYVDLSLKKDLREISQKNRGKTPVTLPASLREIEAFGVKDTGICKLRGLASEAGYKLEDIFTVAKKYLQKSQATGARVYRYLLKLILTESKYAERAEQIRRLEEDRQNTERLKAEGLAYRGKTFAKNGAVVKVMADGESADVQFHDGSVTVIVKADMPRLYSEIAAGKLRELSDDELRSVRSGFALHRDLKSILAYVDRPAIQKPSETGEEKLNREISAKQLSAGAAANLALIKSMVKAGRLAHS